MTMYCSSQHGLSADNVALRGHTGAIYKTCFMSGNTHLLSASEDSIGERFLVTSRIKEDIFRYFEM